MCISHSRIVTHGHHMTSFGCVRLRTACPFAVGSREQTNTSCFLALLPLVPHLVSQLYSISLILFSSSSPTTVRSVLAVFYRLRVFCSQRRQIYYGFSEGVDLRLVHASERDREWRPATRQGSAPPLPHPPRPQGAQSPPPTQCLRPRHISSNLGANGNGQQLASSSILLLSSLL